MSAPPAVSVVLVTYNYAHDIDEAICSVLAQTHKDLELIIVDDGSTDGTPEKLERGLERDAQRIRVIRHGANRGMAAAYASAIAAVRADVVAFIEADDAWGPRNLELKLQVLERHPEVGVVYGRYEPFGHPGGVLYWRLFDWANALSLPSGRPLRVWPVYLKRNPVASFTHFIVRRALLESVPPLGCHRGNLDWWILAHVSAQAYFWRVPGKPTRWRIHAHSAAFGPVDVRRIWKLKVFLSRLCRSFARSAAGSRWVSAPELEGALRFQGVCDSRDARSIALYALARPLATLRFLAHVLLRNLLLWKA